MTKGFGKFNYRDGLFEDEELFKVTNPLDEFQLKQQLELKGTINKKFFFNEESGFGIFELETDIGNIKIKGTFVDELQEGSSYVVNGFVTEYNKEKQLQSLSYKPITPYSKRGVTAYLSTLHGLKKTRANNIYEVFGNDSIKILIEDPIRISKNVAGIGEKSVLKWQQQLIEQRETEELTIELMGYGLSVKEIRKLFKKYNYNLVDKIKENPYFLSMEVKGYGFKKCDELASNMLYKFDGLERIKSGIIYTIEDNCNANGHVFLYSEQFMEMVDSLLTIRLSEFEIKSLLKEHPNDEYVTVKKYNSYFTIEKKELLNKKEFILDEVSIEKITQALSELVSEYKVVIDENRIYLTNFYRYELITQKEFKRLHVIEETSSVSLEDYVEYLNKYLKDNNIHLEEKQYEAVVSIGYGFGGLHMLNGSAGCGKTFITKIIRHMIQWMFKKNKKKVHFSLFAPTGKAAKIASKAMGDKFSTIHKGLSFKPGIGFEFNETCQLPSNVIILDESTMIDLELMHNLLLAIKTGSKVIFIGDYKQLPSVSPGNCFLDILHSEYINVVTLDVVKRQGEHSGLLKNANRIIAGEMIQTEKEIGDSFFIPAMDNEKILELTLKSVKRLLEKGYDLDDIQVLSPMRKSLIGANYMNYQLQNHFNPKTDDSGLEIFSSEFVIDEQIYKLNFRKGDKVIHVKNNKDLQWHDENLQAIDDEFGVNNGECGRIINIEREKINNSWVNRIYVKYDEGIIIYEDEFRELEHAYALTIHKSQGSQWKAVLLPFSSSFFPMYQNNLIYTAWTRAMEFGAMIGQEYAIKQAIKTFKITERNSYLKERLEELKESA